MFERRLKIYLALLAVVVFVLLGRAAQVQIVRKDYWKGQAAEAMKRTHLVDTTRGNILDRTGKVLAVDKPCIDACVDYRALSTPPDEAWVKQTALDRLHHRLGEGWAKLGYKQKEALRDQEIATVNADIHAMWARLAEISGRSVDDIDDARDAIVRRIEMRQRYVWYKRYEEAVRHGGNKVEPAGWKRWLSTNQDSDALPIDSFRVTVAEQLEPHVILPAIDTDTQNTLGKEIDKYPGLVLRPGTHRTYPYADVACHLLGHLARVDAKDLEDNKGLDELHAYLPNDLIGKTGIESLCEPALRGSRGRVDHVLNEDTVLASQAAVPGQNVRLTVDIELQQQIQSAFASATLRDSYGHVIEENALLHGACVVMDVQSNEVLALVSYPTYDLNHIDEFYTALRDDEINDPMRNRATMSQLEPGSTAKPFCGLAGISAGVIGVNTGIECTGYLVLDGRRFQYGRCWVATKFEGKIPDIRHHLIPYPHEGHDGNPDGFLTYSDALERSCNVFFETVADRLGIDRLSYWYSKFGLGRPTGIGIGEAKGRLPASFPVHVPALRRSTGFFGGIGQGWMAVTPIQMANGVAMIARNGIWMRPRLLRNDADGNQPAVKPGAWQDIPDRVDLHLPPEALKAAHLGMLNVVNAKSGTGKGLVAGDKMLEAMLIAGKTGTAQAARFSIIERDASGHVVLDEHHHPKRKFLAPSTPAAIATETTPAIPAYVNPQAPWYRAADVRGHDLNHAWYIGFAPADHPKIAFAVMVEYGGSGGVAAASVGRAALEACISRGYLTPRTTTQPVASDAQ